MPVKGMKVAIRCRSCQEQKWSFPAAQSGMQVARRSALAWLRIALPFSWPGLRVGLRGQATRSAGWAPPWSSLSSSGQRSQEERSPFRPSGSSGPWGGRLGSQRGTGADCSPARSSRPTPRALLITGTGTGSFSSATSSSRGARNHSSTCL